EGSVAAEAAVHVDDVLLADAEALRDLIDLVVAQVALVERRNPALGLAQVEEQLLLARGRAHLHQRPRAQDVFLDRGANPPHRVSGELEALVRLEALDRLHEADIALGNHFANRQAIAAIAHGDLGHEPQMRSHQLVRRLAVPMLAPALGEHVFLLRLQHREPLDLLQVAGESRFARDNGKRRGPEILQSEPGGRPPPAASAAFDLLVWRQAWPKKGRSLGRTWSVDEILFILARPARLYLIACPPAML